MKMKIPMLKNDNNRDKHMIKAKVYLYNKWLQSTNFLRDNLVSYEQ